MAAVGSHLEISRRFIQHANFYNNFKTEALVRDDIERVKRLLAVLDGVA